MPIVPVNLIVTPLSERGQLEPSTWTGTDPTDALRVANTIWMPANIQFHLKQDVVFDTPLDLPKGSRTRDQLVLDVLSDRRPTGTLHPSKPITVTKPTTRMGSTLQNCLCGAVTSVHPPKER